MPTKDLSPEIVEKIIQLLPPQAAYQCMFVSKLWSIFATYKFYEALTLNDKKLHALLSLNKNKKQDPPSLKYVHWVKELKIQQIKLTSRVPPQKLLAYAVLFFPSLKVLDIASSPDCQLYLRGLSNKVKKEDMKNIQQIKFFRKEDSYLDYDTMADYISACYRFRKTITHLQLYNVMSGYNIKGNFKNYLEFLSLFKNLTHLYIDVDRLYKLNKGSDSSITASVLQVCPNLISFELENSYSLLDQQQENIVDTVFRWVGSMEVAERVLSSPTGLSALASIGLHIKTLPSTPLPPPTSSPSRNMNLHLRNLVLILPTLEISQMEYIMTNIATSKLDNFVLELTREIFHEWIHCVDNQTIMKFAEHLSLVKDLNFGVSNYKSVSERVQSGQLINEEEVSKRSRFWMFVDSLKGNRDLQCHMKFDISPNPIEKTLNFGIQIEKDKTMFLGHVIAFEDFFIEDEEGALSSDFFIPSYASTVQALDIDIPEGYLDRLQKYIYKNCPQLY